MLDGWGVTGQDSGRPANQVEEEVTIDRLMKKSPRWHPGHQLRGRVRQRWQRLRAMSRARALSHDTKDSTNRGVYQTENSSIVIMYSLSGLKLYHMWVGLIGCDQGGGFKDSRGRCGDNIMQDGVVYWQHGAVVEENLHLCIKSHHPKIYIYNPKSVYMYLEIHMLKS